MCQNNLAIQEKYSESERRKYEESRKEYWDYYSTKETAEKKGRAEGQKQEKTETVRRLKALGLTIEQIAQGTDLTIDKVMTILS